MKQQWEYCSVKSIFIISFHEPDRVHVAHGIGITIMKPDGEHETQRFKSTTEAEDAECDEDKIIARLGLDGWEMLSAGFSDKRETEEDGYTDTTTSIRTLKRPI